MDVTTSIRDADLRPEIEGIQELHKICRCQDRDAYEKRKIRLEQIEQELSAFFPSPRTSLRPE
jgi:hypothetical protein